MKKCKYCLQQIAENRRGLVCTTCKNGLDRYNLNRLDQVEILESQENKCKLCEKEISLHSRNKGFKVTACIDHDHKSGNVRGILCHACNISLGYLETKIGIDKLIKYLGPRSLTG